MHSGDLLSKLHDQPFKPFKARLSNASTIDVLDPHSVVVGPSSAIMPMEYGKDDRGNSVVLRWKTVALSHIVEFVNIDTRDDARRRRK